MQCRHCANLLQHTFLDLGFAPPSNAYLSERDLVKPETYFPLRVMVCEKCWLVQTQDYTDAESLFTANYAYFSSVSKSWLKHAQIYSSKIIESLKLGRDSFVVEIASNDGYLLRNFVEAKIPCLGIEPTDSTAVEAEALGIPVVREFFGEALGAKLAAKKKADLIVGNNVFAHVPDINDFSQGIKKLLKPEGIVTLEFPHLLKLIELNQFDTVYHEHFSYLSLNAVSRIFTKIGLRIFDVEELSTHGGSLRTVICHVDSNRETLPSVGELMDREQRAGLENLDTYLAFQQRADKVKDDLLLYLVEQKRAGKMVVAYGAAAKGNTLLNYAGIKPDLLSIVCDAAPAKQGNFMPGSHIPIVNPEMLREMKPDIVLVLPWNIAEEVADQNSYIREWGGQFAIAVPQMKVFERSL